MPTSIRFTLLPRDAYRWALLVILLVGFALRVRAADRINERFPDRAAHLIGDEASYDGPAIDLVGGYGYVWAGRPPLYPAWLALVHRTTGLAFYHAFPYVQTLLSIAIIALTASLGRRLGGEPAGLLAAFFAAMSYVLIQQPVTLLSEILFTPLLVAAVLLLAMAMVQPLWWTALVAGLALGATDLVRPTLLLFPAFALLPFAVRLGWRRGARATAWYAVGTLVVIAPWILHLRARFQAWIPLAHSNAILWQGSPEYYHLVRDSGYTYIRVWSEKIYPGQTWREHDPMTVAGDRWWTARAVRSIRDEPPVYARYSAEKAVTYWVGDPEADWDGSHPFDYRALRRVGYGGLPALELMLARLLIFPALVAAWLLRRSPYTLAIGAVMAYCTLLHAATHAEARLSEPLQPLLIALVAAAAVRLARRSSRDAATA